jgi:hypothetical protein
VRSSWPPIEEPLLRERLAMDDEAFAVFMRDLRRSVPPRAFTPEVWATAIGYPWERPARSFLLDGDRVELLDDMEPEPRRALLAARERGPDGAARYPLLAFGSNGAPATLQRKFAHFDAAERRVLVLAGELHGFDVGAVAHPTAYGSMAASLFESPGTAVRAAVSMVSAAQLTQLCWTEIGYRFGRLDGVRFAADQDGLELATVFAYAARSGPSARTASPWRSPRSRPPGARSGRWGRRSCSAGPPRSCSGGRHRGGPRAADLRGPRRHPARGERAHRATGRPFAPAAGRPGVSRGVRHRFTHAGRIARVFDHVSLEVADLARSAAFYDALLGRLGIRRLHEGRRRSPTVASTRASGSPPGAGRPARPSGTSPSRRPAAPRSTPRTPPAWPRAARTPARPVPAPATGVATTRATCSTPTATASRSSPGGIE